MRPGSWMARRIGAGQDLKGLALDADRAAQSLFQTESPGDFHSTGASYVPRMDSRGTKPARATPKLWPARAISRAAKHYEINTIPMKMGACILPEGHSQGF